MSIWGQLQGSSGDATLEAIDESQRASGSPYRPSAPLPLPEVQWAMAVEAGELAENQEWPPPRFGTRQERLQTYHDLWRGDVSRLMDTRYLDDHSVGAINVFRRLGKFVADLLVREVPTAGNEGALNDAQLMRLAHSLATSAIRSGAGYLFFVSTEQGPLLRSIDARYAFPTESGGWLVVEPRMGSGRPTTPNALQITAIDISGQVNVAVHHGTPTGIGQGYTVGPAMALGPLGQGGLLPILALPEQAEMVMGTSWYEDLITIVIQKARRMAGNTKVLDDNSDPLLMLRGNLDAYTRLPGVPPSSANAALAPQDIQRESLIAKKLRSRGTFVLPDGVEDAEYVTWDGSHEWAMAHLDRLDKEFRFLSGLPAALDSDTEIPSGVSLRRMFWQFDAAVGPLFHGITSVISIALAAFGLTLEWENVFEVVEGEPVEDEREDVDDEGSARRGESR